MSHTVFPFRPAPTAGASTAAVTTPAIVTDPNMTLVSSSIDRFGMHLVHVGEGCACGNCGAAPLPPDRRFGYTIGLTDLGHSELMVRGLGARRSAALLTRWGDSVLAGHVFDSGHLLCEGPGGPTWELATVRRPARTLRWAARYYPTPRPGGLSALELVPARRRCPCDGCR